MFPFWEQEAMIVREVGVALLRREGRVGGRGLVEKRDG